MEENFISFGTSPQSKQKELLENGDWDRKPCILENDSGGFLKFSTTAGPLIASDFSGAYFTSQDAKGWVREKTVKELKPPPPHTAEVVSEAKPFAGAVYFEGTLPNSQTKQYYVFNGSGIYCFSKETTSDE